MVSITRNSTAQYPFVQSIATICLISLHQLFNEKGRRKKDTHLLELHHVPATRLGSKVSFASTTCAVEEGLALVRICAGFSALASQLGLRNNFGTRAHIFIFHRALKILKSVLLVVFYIFCLLNLSVSSRTW
jgi:hypothetical protein